MKRGDLASQQNGVPDFRNGSQAEEIALNETSLLL